MTPPAGLRTLPLPDGSGAWTHAAGNGLRAFAAARTAVLPFHAPAGGVRLRRADVRDVPALHALLNGFAAEGLLLPRTPERVRAMLPDFLLAEGDERLLGCAALRLYATGRAELCALAVARDAHGRGVGRRLAEALLAEARGMGAERVFALTLQPGFFTALGFQPTDVAGFPEKQADDCAACPRRARCPEICVAHDLVDALSLPEA